ncbi:hypothetical protein SNOUR_41615 [Streptomyces noursei ATCC 11455]|uniref:DUF6882 domain-containing protein n=1 Tax=Streptomyces noursei TaxID=1971 RepID=UPI00081CCF7F|nr:hypothetical protein SNOUR_41615 [Streptomyces noursei ATCC 11455]
MGFFKRNAKLDSAPTQGRDAEGLSTLLLQGEDMIDQLARAHMSWGLGSADRWGLDQRTGTITWTFPDKTATAQAQILGSWSPTASSWQWAWANDSILPELSQDACTVRDWAAAHGHDALAAQQVEADEQMAGTLAALSVRITNAVGFYRGVGATSVVMITFGPVMLVAQDGSTSTFTIDIE